MLNFQKEPGERVLDVTESMSYRLQELFEDLLLQKGVRWAITGIERSKHTEINGRGEPKSYVYRKYIVTVNGLGNIMEAGKYMQKELIDTILYDRIVIRSPFTVREQEDGTYTISIRFARTSLSDEIRD
jgi:hypothetical protein